MNYNLNDLSSKEEKKSTWQALNNLLSFIKEEKVALIKAVLVILINSTILLMSPLLTGFAIDRYITHKNLSGLFLFSLLLLGSYLVALFTGYFQTKLMGTVSQRMLFSLRNAVFQKLLDLPVSFFNQNKVGDLISRINNDTDKINQFFSQSLIQFVGGIIRMTGAGIFLLTIHFKLGVTTLIPALFIYVFTILVSPWVKKVNASNLKTVGGLSSEIQESLQNFKTIIAFNRRDYFKDRFHKANKSNYQTAIRTGLANNIFMPVYGFFSTLAQMIVVVIGIKLIQNGSFSIGFLLSYLLYVSLFYDPLKQLAALWSSFQVAMASWDRISVILNLNSDLVLIQEVSPSLIDNNSLSLFENTSPNLQDNTSSFLVNQSFSTVSESQKIANNGSIPKAPVSTLLEFKHIYFSYTQGQEILHNINLSLEPSRKYALVGPTGGGKTTTASLMARLYDPTKGEVLFKGQDIRSYSPSELSKKIGFILQEPFLFSGTVSDNIIYGNLEYQGFKIEEIRQLLKDFNLESILSSFDGGLETPIQAGSENISLGQKQIIAFVRAVLRKPEILILDEATSNIDTVTEQLLEEILGNLPSSTTQVVIAHRLNTIRNADEIYFVNSGEVVSAGSFDGALDLLMNRQRLS